MERFLCILADIDEQFAGLDLGQGQSALQCNSQSLGALGVGRCIIIGRAEHEDLLCAVYKNFSTHFVSVKEFTWASVLGALLEASVSGTLVLAFADAPWINYVLTQRLFNLHETYRAHFTFADAYPLGLAPELVDAEAVPALLNLANRQMLPCTRAGLFELVKTDVNSFDIETDIAQDDMRLLRLMLFADSKEHFQLLRSLVPCFVPLNKEQSPEAVLSWIRSNEKVLRTIPCFFSIQLTNDCPQSCSYCPWSSQARLHDRNSCMPIELLCDLILRIHALNPGATVNVSLWGEPALYPHFEHFVRFLLDNTALALYVETSGISWPRTAFNFLAQHEERARLTWILSLDARDDATYRTMRGEGFLEAWACARELRKLFGNQVYVQAVRCSMNDEVIQKFYQDCKAEGFQVIIQKYNHFSKRLPDLGLADIAPFQRFACWHLKRDMNILMDGRVLLCREDFEANRVFGNVFTQDLFSIWKDMHTLYEEQLEKKFEGICELCDEYYTYNA